MKREILAIAALTVVFALLLLPIWDSAVTDPEVGAKPSEDATGEGRVADQGVTAGAIGTADAGIPWRSSTAPAEGVGADAVTSVLEAEDGLVEVGGESVRFGDWMPADPPREDGLEVIGGTPVLIGERIDPQPGREPGEPEAEGGPKFYGERLPLSVLEAPDGIDVVGAESTGAVRIIGERISPDTELY